MRRLEAALVAAALFIAGRGGSDDGEGRADTLSERTTTADAPTTTAGTKSGEELQRALLTLQDVPTGWTTAQDEDSEDDSTFCEAFDIDAGQGTPAKAETQFKAGETGPFLAHVLVGFEADEAKKAMQPMRAAFDQCRDFTSEQAGEQLKGKFSAMSFPSLGDETFAAKLTAEGGGFTMSGDLVLVRVGNIITLLAHFGLDASLFGSRPADPKVTEQLAGTAVDKVKAL